ncbi:MAG: alpha-D-ribose 1-methylphosphonate 5-triphosphate diphosphatase, partial [Pseudomonadota bacterium]
GAMQLAEIWGDVPRGIAAVTANPARYANLDDRGVIEIGKRADLMRFRMFNDAPMVRSAWSRGARVS